MNLATKAVVYLVGSFFVLALPMFLAAGTVAWAAGWIYLILIFGWLAIGSVLLLKYNPSLLQERLSISQPNQKPSDKLFLALYELFLFGWLVIMPLDAVRFRWSQMAGWLQIVGALIMVVSFIIISLTFRENTFLSPTVRIQDERGQTAISTGPYRYVRHPMYAGGLLLFLGTPFLLGSWYGLLLFLLLIPLLASRILLEERTLSKELQGYAEYMAQVKYHLVPYM